MNDDIFYNIHQDNPSDEELERIENEYEYSVQLGIIAKIRKEVCCNIRIPLHYFDSIIEDLGFDVDVVREAQRVEDEKRLAAKFGYGYNPWQE